MLTHLCLVSSQPTPNLTPVLDNDIAPRRVILLVSHSMTKQADWLKAVLEKRGVRVERWKLPDAYDVEQIQHHVLELLEREQALIEEKAIMLNATGGTKPMSIAAYEAFRAYELPIFYVHPETDRLIWLYPQGRAAIDLANRIRIEPFLEAHGVLVDGEPGRNIPDPALLETGKEIVARIKQFTEPLSQLNWLAATAARSSLLSERVRDDKGWLAELLDLFARNGFLKRENGRLRFANENARFFANGGWLEYLVFDAIRTQRRQDDAIQDIVRSIRVQRQRKGEFVPNEIDVAFLRDNRLHIIECKTRKFVGKDEDGPGAEALYKLDSLSDLMGGLQARAMLVSFREIAPHDRARANDMGIAVCSGQELQMLQRHIKNFMAGE